MKRSSVVHFDNRMDILIFAAFATEPFTVKGISELVLDTSMQKIRPCLCDLVEAGYLERVDKFNYQATSMAKELFSGAVA